MTMSDVMQSLLIFLVAVIYSILLSLPCRMIVAQELYNPKKLNRSKKISEIGFLNWYLYLNSSKIKHITCYWILIASVSIGTLVAILLPISYVIKSIGVRNIATGTILADNFLCLYAVLLYRYRSRKKRRKQ